MKGKLVLAAAAALGLSGAIAGTASAMPMAPLSSAQVSGVDNVRWVCGPYRCFWRPNYYSYGYYGGGPRPYYGPRYYGPPRYYGYGGYRRRF